MLITLATVTLITIGFLIGCVIDKTSRPSDVSQPDKCVPNGPCNVGKPSQTHIELIAEIQTSDLTPDVKRQLLLDLGVIDETDR
jgi:hypothetical protein